jgi:hypothetical protein
VSTTLYASTTGGVFKSIDGGGSWAAANNGLSETSIRNVVIDPNTSATLYAATSGGGVFRSADAAATWTTLNVGLTNDDVRAIAISPSGACLHAGSFGGGVFDFATVLDPCAALGPPVMAAVLPNSRSVQVGIAATAFATIINPAGTPALACSIAPITKVPAAFSFQTTDPHTNALIGQPNTPVDIPAGGLQTFLIALTPSQSIRGADVQFGFSCFQTAPAPVISGVNTLFLVASNGAVPDIVALAATINNDGIVNIPGATGTGAFSIATVNVGVDGSITASADTGSATLPVTMLICETDPATARCQDPPAASVRTGIHANETPTFSVFVVGNGTVPFDPAANRIFVRFKDGSNVTRGSTSAAVRTQ